MPQLTIVEKDHLRNEFTDHIIGCVIDNDCPAQGLGQSIQRSMGSRKTYFGGGPIDKIYQKHFNRSASRVYDYVVKEWSGLLDAAGISYEPVEDPEPEPAPAPDPQNSQQEQQPQQAGFAVNPIVIVVVAIAGFFIYRART